MFVWDWLGGESTIEQVVPDAYAAYRRPIAAALRFFVENLPAARAESILGKQLSLDPSTGAAQRLMILARACPVLHKLGQVLARDRRLDPGLRVQLQRLESMDPRVPTDVLQDQIEQELGPLERLGLTLEPAALAEASVAVVVPFQYRDRAAASAGAGRGVFKVIKPGVEEQLGQDLALLEDLGAFLDERCARLGIPPLDYQDVFAEVRALLGQEVHLDGEQRNLAAARAAYADLESLVHIPCLLPWSTPRVTAMERIDGWKVTEDEATTRTDRSLLGRRIVEALIAHPLWSAAPSGLFHADPHAGNLLVTPSGRLAILDWSLAGTLEATRRQAVAQVMLGALTLDARPILGALRELGERAVDGPALKAVVVRHLHRIRRGTWPGFQWLKDLLDEAVQTARLRVGADLMMFRRMLLMVEGVVADVAMGTGRDLDTSLTVSFVSRLAREWPVRAFAPPYSRSFGTQLSNADLALLASLLPLTTARIALDCWQQLLTASAGASNLAGLP
jgi:ubiquinone biosynthesis protein